MRLGSKLYPATPIGVEPPMSVILVLWATISGASYIRPVVPVCWTGGLAMASAKRSNRDTCSITRCCFYLNSKWQIQDFPEEDKPT